MQARIGKVNGRGPGFHSGRFHTVSWRVPVWVCAHVHVDALGRFAQKVRLDHTLNGLNQLRQEFYFYSKL